MKKQLFAILGCLFILQSAMGQELFISTEPASNMPAHSMGLRANGSVFEKSGALKSQFSPEIMYGASASLMCHASAYINNYFTNDYEFRGVNFYAKYRFLSIDGMQKHFRMAAFARTAFNFKPGYSSEVNIEGDYPGLNGGLVATQLLHKLAIASSVAYTRIMPAGTDMLHSGDGLDYTLSFGYLLLPKTYTGYGQTNLNLYFELLGKSQRSSVNSEAGNPVRAGTYLDAAPGIQFIFHSLTRLDLSWRAQIAGDMSRTFYSQVFIRLEHNIFEL